MSISLARRRAPRTRCVRYLRDSLAGDRLLIGSYEPVISDDTRGRTNSNSAGVTIPPFASLPLRIPRPRVGKLSEHDVTLRESLGYELWLRTDRPAEALFVLSGQQQWPLLTPPWSPYIINYCINLTGRKQSIIHGIRATTDIAAPPNRPPARPRHPLT